MMHVSSVDFINSPALYLERIKAEPVVITQDGEDIAVLAQPSKTPIADSLVGLLKGIDVQNLSDIKDMRLNS